MRGSMQSLSIAKQMKLTNKLFEVPVERGGAAVVCSMGCRCNAARRDICGGQHLQGEKTREIDSNINWGSGGIEQDQMCMCTWLPILSPSPGRARGGRPQDARCARAGRTGGAPQPRGEEPWAPCRCQGGVTRPRH
jgi:hypothetical protein